MTALVKQRSRGCVLAQSVSAVYVALAGLQSIEISGEKNTTYPSETLDQTATNRLKDADGYGDPPTIKASGFFDPGHATYTNLKTILTTPPVGGTNFKVTYTDSGPTSEIRNVTGVGLGKKIETSKGIMSDIELECSGDAS